VREYAVNDGGVVDGGDQFHPAGAARTAGGRRRPAERPPPEGASVAYAQEVLALLRTAKGRLAPDGLLFLLDPLFAPGQSRAARFVVSKDRG